jgi:hypothetical protein
MEMGELQLQILILVGVGTKYMLQIKLTHGNLISSTSYYMHRSTFCVHAIHLACNFCHCA